MLDYYNVKAGKFQGEKMKKKKRKRRKKKKKKKKKKSFYRTFIFSQKLKFLFLPSFIA